MSRKVIFAISFTSLNAAICTHLRDGEGNEYSVLPAVPLMPHTDYTAHLFSDFTAEIHLGEVFPPGAIRRVKFSGE